MNQTPTEEDPNEYYAEFHDDPSSLDVLLFVKYLAKDKGIDLLPSIELSEQGRKHIEKILPVFGSLGYKIEEALPELAKLEESELYAKITQEYSLPTES